MKILRQREFNIAERLAGRKVLYHGTSDSGAESIRKEGLRHDYAQSLDDATTRRKIEKHKNGKSSKMDKLTDWNADFDDLVYLTSYKPSAEFMAKHNKKLGKGGKVLKISLPYDKHKDLVPVSNPEYALAAHIHKPDDMARHLFGKPFKDLSKKDQKDIKSFIKAKNGDFIIKGEDISPDNIKGSKTYQKVTPKEIWDYQTRKHKKK